MSLLRSSSTIGFYTLLSRVLGYIRDITIASGLGAGVLSDAFFVAFKIPNFFRRLFAEGAFNAAFVPMFAGVLAGEGRDPAQRFADQVFSFLLLVLLILSVVFIAFMPWLMFGLAPGFADDPEKFDLTILLTRITFPYLLFISLVSLLGGVLNSFDRFAAVAATPILLNLCLIIVPEAIQPWVPSLAHGLAIAVFVAGVAQFVWLVWWCRRLGLLPKLVRPRLSPEVKKLLLLIGPAALGAGAAQVNLLIDLIIASHLDNAVSYLYYADRLNELPLAVIGIAVGTALLPMLSRQLREGKFEQAAHVQNRGIELALLLALPAAAALMVLAEPMIRIMFERGAFDALATQATYPALMAFAAGLPAFVLIKVLTPSFYARHDTKTPLKIALICIGTNFALNLILIIPFKHVGMAMATTTAGWLNVLLMLYHLKQRDWFEVERAVWHKALRMVAASAVMSVALFGLVAHLTPWINDRLFWQVCALSLLVACGLSVYGASALALRCVSVGRLSGYFRK